MIETYSPFLFGQIVKEDSFTNRTKEKNLLKSTLISGNSAILISPRRIGKSSLIKQVFSELIKRQKIAITQLDITSYRTEVQFLEEFANKLIQANQTKYKSFLAGVSSYLKFLTPILSYKAGGMEQISFSFNWGDRKKTKEEILSLPEVLYKQTGKQQIIAIDEFQNISRFEGSEALQFELRSYWQHQTATSFCLFGSKRHMMEEIFSSESAPFYNFGQIIKLQRIAKKEWMPFILSKFEKTKKPISDHYASTICSWTQRHTEHMQFLSHLIWVSTPTNKKVRKENMIKGFMDYLHATSTHSTDLFDKLSNIQINMLRAILEGEKQLTGKNSIIRYNLKTSASAIKAKKALLREDLLEQLTPPTSYRVINPAFEWWLRSKLMGVDIISENMKMLE